MTDIAQEYANYALEISAVDLHFGKSQQNSTETYLERDAVPPILEKGSSFHELTSMNHKSTDLKIFGADQRLEKPPYLVQALRPLDRYLVAIGRRN